MKSVYTDDLGEIDRVKSILEDSRMRPTNDGMTLSQEFKIRARRYMGKKKKSEEQ